MGFDLNAGEYFVGLVEALRYNLDRNAPGRSMGGSSVWILGPSKGIIGERISLGCHIDWCSHRGVSGLASHEPLVGYGTFDLCNDSSSMSELLPKDSRSGLLAFYCVLALVVLATN